MHVVEKVMLRQKPMDKVKKEDTNDIKNEHWRSTKLMANKSNSFCGIRSKLLILIKKKDV